MELIDLEGNPLREEIKGRRRQKSFMKHPTRHGDVLFALTVDHPDTMGEDDFNRLLYEYGNILAEAFRKRMK